MVLLPVHQGVKASAWSMGIKTGTEIWSGTEGCPTAAVMAVLLIAL